MSGDRELPPELLLRTVDILLELADSVDHPGHVAGAPDAQGPA